MRDTNLTKDVSHKGASFFVLRKRVSPAPFLIIGQSILQNSHIKTTYLGIKATFLETIKTTFRGNPDIATLQGSLH